MDLILSGLLILVLSYGFVWALRKWAGYGRLLDIPNSRSSHAMPTPAVADLLL